MGLGVTLLPPHFEVVILLSSAQWQDQSERIVCTCWVVYGSVAGLLSSLHS